MLVFCVNLNAQVDKYLDSQLLVAQKEGSEQAVCDYFSDIGSDADYLYVLMYIPGRSPRMETYIKMFDRDLSAVDSSAVSVLLSVGIEKKVAEAYNESQGYRADYYMYDENARYLDFLSFNFDGLRGTYILKVDNRCGRIVVAGVMFDYNSDFLTELVTAKEYKPFHTFKLAGSKKYGMPADVSIRDLKYEKYMLESDSLLVIGELNGMPALKDDALFLSDELSGKTLCFKKKNGNGSFVKCGELEIPDKYKDEYLEVAENDVKMLKDAGSLYYMQLSAGFFPDGKLGISYSIPYIWYNNSDSTSLGIMNRPVIAVFDADDLLFDRLVRFDSNPDYMMSQDFIYYHFNVFPISESKIIMGVEKMGWPVDGFEEFNGNAEHDVFMDEYYDGFTPVMSCVDIESGKEVGKFGTLPEYSRQTRTGYYFSNSFSADSYGDEFIYSTGSDGLIHLCDVSSFEKDKTAYEIFRPDISSFTEIDDKMFYSTDYAFVYMPYFQRCIKDLRLTHDKIHALVRIRLSSDYNDDSFAYEYYVLDRATGKVETNYVLKPDNENEKVLGWAFTSDPDNVRVFYLAECGNGYSVSFISLK